MAEVQHDRSIRNRQTIRIVIWVVLAAIVAALAIANIQDTEVDYLFGTVTSSLWIVIVVSVVAGMVLGYLARSRRD